MTKIRLDALLVERGLFDSREKARRAVLAGSVKIEDRVMDKPGTQVDDRVDVYVEPGPAYVSRGADKLNRALDFFRIDVKDKAVLDAGASTGGFTQVLLERGAGRVIAVDVGYGQLAWKLRQDPRVDVYDRTNIRMLKAGDLPEPAGLVTADLSFISLGTVADALTSLSLPDADFVFLVKPQFEAGKGGVGKGGIIREASRHEEILKDVLARLRVKGLRLEGLTFSPVTGADGNIEFLAWMKKAELGSGESSVESRETEELVEKVVKEAHKSLKE